MRIVQVNAVYDPAADAPLSEWAAAIAAAGAATSVVQRFRSKTELDRDGVHYQFVSDKLPPWLSTFGAPPEFVDAIAAQSPDLVHINGLIFPQLVSAIRARLGNRIAIVVQHRSGDYPLRGSGFVGMWDRRKWRQGLDAADAISVTAKEQLEPWIEAGLIGSQKIVEIIEASTTLREVGRERARTAIGVSGNPVILWVGRRTSNIDPISVLDGLEHALPDLPAAQVMMVFGDDTLLQSVESRVRSSALLGKYVILNSRVSREEMPNYYGAADIFISGSHSDGSGSALIEAMAAGVVPVVTDLPSFRRIAGDRGRRWAIGDANACGDALLDAYRSDLISERTAVKAHFDRELSWRAIGASTVTEYRSIADAKRSS